VTASLAAANPGLEEVAAGLEEGRTPAGPLEPGASYAISKHAVGRWVRRAAPREEWAGAGILLNAICPGLVETPMQAQSKSNPAVLALIEAIPMRRTAQPRELARAFAFLASADNTYVSGQLLYVDGGLEASMRPDRV
jgi:NAD(P)-dependent dehydrogenase (short-subunit alcohol dehydrogenase family)